MALLRPSYIAYTPATARLTAIAVAVALLAITAFAPASALASGANGHDTQVKTGTKVKIGRELAAELRIVRADVIRLNERTLPPLHRKGLRVRIRGALGVLPWLLRLNADEAGAKILRTWQKKSLDNGENRTRLVALLTRLSNAHRVNVAYFKALPDTQTTRNEARAIHKAYCAQCHDAAGRGDPDIARPARNLFFVMRGEDESTSLALLINGVKGDAKMQFRNPLNDARLAALWRYYRTAPR